jgi:excisionase family DNA binding protein
MNPSNVQNNSAFKVKPIAISVKTAAALLEVSEKTIRRMIDDKLLKPIRHRRLLRIPISQLKKLVDG